MLVAAPSANAAFGLAGLSAQPANGSAGANSDFTISLTVQDPAADLKDLTIHLPPGLVGNPLATPTCSESDLNADHCDPVSQVGTTATGALLSGTIPITVAGNVYNVAPRPGEPARFGIVLHPGPGLPPTILQSGASLRQSDFGLDTVLNNLPNTASGFPIDITSVSLTLSGIAGDPPTGFIRNPTSCGEHVVGFDAAAYDGQTASGQTSFATGNCASEPFAPGFSATLRPMGKDGLKPEVTTVISQTIAEAGLSRAQVVLPHDLGADNAVLSHQCPAQQFQAGNCPPDSIIGSAVAASPLQSQALTGPVALVAPPTPALPQVGLDLRGPLALKLTGNFVLTPQGTGVAFEGLPDIPISRFQLTFFGGANGIVLAARQVCKPPPLNFGTDFLAHSGATTNGSTAAQIDGTCGQDAGGHGRKPKAKLELGRPRLRPATDEARGRRPGRRSCAG